VALAHVDPEFLGQGQEDLDVAQFYDRGIRPAFSVRLTDVAEIAVAGRGGYTRLCGYES
jgi:hypothetical protein